MQSTKKGHRLVSLDQDCAAEVGYFSDVDAVSLIFDHEKGDQPHECGVNRSWKLFDQPTKNDNFDVEAFLTLPAFFEPNSPTGRTESVAHHQPCESISRMLSPFSTDAHVSQSASSTLLYLASNGLRVAVLRSIS